MKKYCTVIAVLLAVYLSENQTLAAKEEYSGIFLVMEFSSINYYDMTKMFGFGAMLTPYQKSEQIGSPTDDPEYLFEECKPYNPPRPNFKITGRRISEVKCHEYIWNIETNQEKRRRSTICADKAHSFYNINPVIAGGFDAKPGEFPHMVVIGWRGTSGTMVFKCGGSLISSKFVLTAAHCTSASSADTSLADPSPKIVRVSSNVIYGSKNKTKRNNFDINISRIIPHPEYKPPKKYYDIALMELEHELGFYRFVQPACLWGRRDISKLGTVATITGWGVLFEGSSKISEKLQAAVIEVFDDNKCNSLLQPYCNRNWCGIQDHQLCAGNFSGGVDACQGDSGGPLQVKINLDFERSYKHADNMVYHIIGVTSFGIGCAQPGLPGIYTRVSSFIDWIEKIVWPEI